MAVLAVRASDMGYCGTVNSVETKDSLIKWVGELFDKYHYFKYEFKCLGGTRTDTQNNALHLYCGQVAETLNDAGFTDVVRVSAKGPGKFIEVPYTKDGIKLRWSLTQEKLTGQFKTRDLEKLKLGDVYDVFNRYLANEFGVHVPFPNKELLNKDV